MAIFVPEYWPLFTTDEQLVSNFYASDGSGLHFTSIFSYDQALNSMEFQNYGANGNWLNTWFYQYQPSFGIAEWQDQYPQTGILAALFGPVKQVTMSTPIGWGDWANIGSTYTNSPSINPLGSNPPGQFGTGYQAVTFEALDPTFTLSNGTTYTNVLVFADVQIWSGQAQETWFWMAQGLGPIAIQFFAPDPSTAVLEPTTRFDRASTSVQFRRERPGGGADRRPGRHVAKRAGSGKDMFVFAGDFRASHGRRLHHGRQRARHALARSLAFRQSGPGHRQYSSGRNQHRHRRSSQPGRCDYPGRRQCGNIDAQRQGFRLRVKCGCDFASKRAPRSSMLNSLMRKEKAVVERARICAEAGPPWPTSFWRYFKVF